MPGSRIGPFAAAAFLFIGATAFAETKPLGAPSVAFHATVEVLGSGGNGFTYQLYYTPDRQRIEYRLRGRKIVSIVDDRTRRATILFPDRKRFRSAAYQRIEFAFGIAGAKARLTRLGAETVIGVPTVKYRATSRSRAREDFEGIVWITADRIVMKMDGQLTKGPRTRKLLQTITAIKIGPLDPNLFVIPAGYTAD
jgi:hypothetical protein